jgi:hypothetical protein
MAHTIWSVVSQNMFSYKMTSVRRWLCLSLLLKVLFKKSSAKQMVLIYIFFAELFSNKTLSSKDKKKKKMYIRTICLVFQPWYPMQLDPLIKFTTLRTLRDCHWATSIHHPSINLSIHTFSSDIQIEIRIGDGFFGILNMHGLLVNNNTHFQVKYAANG